MKRNYLLLVISLLLLTTFSLHVMNNNTLHRKHRIITQMKRDQLNTAENTKTNGSYVVGIDIPEGEYVLVTTDTQKPGKVIGDYTIFKDISKNRVLEFVEIVVNKEELLQRKRFSKAHFKRNEIEEYSSDLVLLKKNQVIKLNNIKIYPVNLRKKPNISKLVEGSYKVGRDIPAGNYEISSCDLPSRKLHTIWIMNNVDPEKDVEDSLIEKYQDYTKQTYPQRILLKNGEYISFSDLIFSKIK